MNNIKKLFSVSNSQSKRHKIYRILGIKIKIKRHKNTKVVYTCITGNYDNLKEHTYIDNNWDYICFTDNKTLLKNKKIGIWRIKPLQYNKLDNTKNARWHKMHPHILFPDYDYSLWIDANFDIKTPYIFQTIEKRKGLILVPIHFQNKCVYEEADFILVRKKEIEENVKRAVKFLKKQKMPTNYGLNETNIIYRKHNNPKIKQLMKFWFKYIEEISKRDQLFFSYALLKNDIKVEDISIPNTRVDTENFSFIKHQKVTELMK